MLDLEAKKLLTAIPVATITQRIAVSPDDRWVITADQTKQRLIVMYLSDGVPLDLILTGS